MGLKVAVASHRIWKVEGNETISHYINVLCKLFKTFVVYWEVQHN